ncbi:hypothetical protein B0H15DRAFT_517415 [Mycena belliarum]|uniref:Uncharacterized protein n=1 Tax=Mycena belliarum TaxID=1033014 RepID=A0AAD6TTT7_9AGAR|nr:hypothetical protein B0H15DRAFT_517415 [Mycena belliae]
MDARRAGDGRTDGRNGEGRGGRGKVRGSAALPGVPPPAPTPRQPPEPDPDSRSRTPRPRPRPRTPTRHPIRTRRGSVRLPYYARRPRTLRYARGAAAPARRGGMPFEARESSEQCATYRATCNVRAASAVPDHAARRRHVVPSALRPNPGLHAAWGAMTPTLMGPTSRCPGAVPPRQAFPAINPAS